MDVSLEKVKVGTSGGGYEILIGSGLVNDAGGLIRGLLKGKAFLITDENVFKLYGERLIGSLNKAGVNAHVISLEPGESSKSVESLQRVYEELAENAVNRNDIIIAFGGGVAGDLAGFAAATILRGIRYVQIPTTLLSQVDSSVGGKTAINLKAGKNLAGAFYQPALVIIDPQCLNTLPDREFSSGMAEVIKYGVILDEELFSTLEQNGGRECVMALCPYVIGKCCELKAGIVGLDEKDNGRRNLLNFGHTFGHVYEHMGGYQRYTHGQAVAAGMCAAARIGVRLGVTDPAVVGRLEALVEQFGLPLQLEHNVEAYRPVMQRDKKARGQSVTFILPEVMGNAVARQIELDRLLELYKGEYACDIEN